MGDPIINESTSVIQIQTSGLQAGAAAIVYVSTTATPGQLVTVRDSMGFLSTPQSILLSTTGGATLLGGGGESAGTSSLIRQAFGFQTLVANSTGNAWTLVNVNPFPDPTSSYTIKALTTTSMSGTPSGTLIQDYLSTYHTQVTANTTTSTLSIFSALHASTITVNAFNDYISTFALRNSAVIGGSLKIYGSTATVGSLLAISSITTGGDFFAGGQNISSRNGVIGLSGDLVTLSSLRAQRGPSTGILYVRTLDLSPLSTQLFRGNLTVRNNVDAAQQIIANQTTSTPLLETSTTFVRSTLQFGLTTPLKYIQIAPTLFNFVNNPFTASTISTVDVTCTNSFFTSNLVAEQLSIVSTISSVVFSSAVISNPAGSAEFSSVTINDARVRSLVTAPLLETGDELRAATLSFPSAPLQPFSVPYPRAGATVTTSLNTVAAWTISSLEGATTTRTQLSTNQYAYSTLLTDTSFAAATSATGNSSATQFSTITNSLSALRTITVNPAATLSFSNVPITVSTVETTNLFNSTTLVADGIRVQTLSTTGGNLLLNTSTLLATGALEISTILTARRTLGTSSLVASKALFGAPLLYSTINPSTTYCLTSTYLLNDPPFSQTSGLGTFFSPIEYTSIKTSQAFYAIVDPVRNIPVNLSSPAIATVVGTGQQAYGGDGSFGRIAPIGAVPGRIGCDSQSNLFIGSFAQQGWSLRRIDAATGFISTIAGRNQFYYGDGALGINAAIGSNLTLVPVSSNQYFLQDSDNQRIRLIDRATSTISLFGGTGNLGYTGDDGPALEATFRFPRGATRQPSTGALFVVDSANHVVRKIEASTITTVAGTGTQGYSGDGGPATQATLAFPYGATFDASENLLISDTSNNVIRRVDLTSGIITTYAGTGAAGYSGDGGPATAATFRVPQGLATDNNGYIYIADTSNNVVRKILVDTGDIITFAGDGTPGWSGDGGLAVTAQLRNPIGLGVNPLTNELYIADSGNHCIRRVDAIAGVIGTVVGSPQEAGFSGDGGPPAFAQLFNPSQVVFNPNLAVQQYFIADQGNYRVRFVDLDANLINTVAGNGSPYIEGDGGPASQAMFKSIGAIATHPTATPPVDLYIVDSNAQKVRRINAATGIINTVAGNGLGQYSGDGGPATAASLNFPQFAVLDGQSNLFISDTANQRIRRVANGTGTITTVAGNGQQDYIGDGMLAVSTALNNPRGLSFDSQSNLYIADTSNYRIRRVANNTGIITTFIGAGFRDPVIAGSPPIDTPLRTTTDITIDPINQVYFTELETNRIWYLSSIDNKIRPFNAASPSGAFFGDGGPVSNALLNQPTGLLADRGGNIIVSDSSNFRIRRSYTFGAAQFSRYINMDFTYQNFSTLDGSATISINGNVVKTFTAAATSTISTATFSLTDADTLAYQQNVFNPITLDQTPFITIEQEDTVGYTQLKGRLWVNQVPSQQTARNLVDSNAGIDMNRGFIRFPGATDDITIQNPYNDATMRSLIYTGSLNFSSDPAVKEHIQAASVDQCASTLNTLPLKKYSYNTPYRSTFQTKDTSRLGFLTTDVNPHFPKSISRASSGDHDTLELSQIKATHIGATKSILTMIRDLEKMISTLTEEKNRLERSK